MTHRIKVSLYRQDGLGGEGSVAETRSVPWRPIGAGVCLAAGGQDGAGAEGFGPGPPLPAKAAPRPDSGPANSPADGLCPLRPPKANQLRMAAKERLQA